MTKRKRRRRQARLTVEVGELVRSHVHNRAKRLGIAVATLVIRAIGRATDADLSRELGS